jgi:phosphoribosylpyrophosphate synthetase
MISMARGASAARVTVVMPLCAYPRQDKKVCVCVCVCVCICRE